MSDTTRYFSWVDGRVVLSKQKHADSIVYNELAFRFAKKQVNAEKERYEEFLKHYDHVLNIKTEIQIAFPEWKDVIEGKIMAVHVRDEWFEHLHYDLERGFHVGKANTTKIKFADFVTPRKFKMYGKHGHYYARDVRPGVYEYVCVESGVLLIRNYSIVSTSLAIHNGLLFSKHWFYDNLPPSLKIDNTKCDLPVIYDINDVESTIHNLRMCFAHKQHLYKYYQTDATDMILYPKKYLHSCYGVSPFYFVDRCLNAYNKLLI